MLPLEEIVELDLQKSLIAYLDKYGFLSELLQTGMNYIKKMKSVRECGAIGLPFYFKPTLDLALMTNISGELGALFCQEPIRAELLLARTVLFALQNHQDYLAAPLPGGFGLDHIRVPLRVSSLPESCLMQRCHHRPSGLVLVRGVLVALSTTSKYIRSCVTRCAVESCLGGYPGRRMSGAYTRGRTCRYCGVEEREKPAEREECEEAFALVLPEHCLTATAHTRGQQYHLVCRDDLVGRLVLGESYEMVCKVSLHPKLPCSALEVCSIPRVYQPNHTLSSLVLPPAIAEAHSKLGHVPGALVMLLASHLGREVLPPGTFMHLRLACLLSLASQGSSRVVPLLVCGGEHCAAAKLLAAAASLAPRCVSHSTQGAVAGLVRKSEEGAANGDRSCWLEAGPLLLASRGVCLLGDWASLKKETKSTVLTCIEKGEVSLQLPGRVMNLPLKTAIWTHCSRTPLKIMRPIMDVFGLPWLAEATETEDAALCNWLLDTAVQGKSPVPPVDEGEFLPDEDIKQILSMVRDLEVSMSSDASTLLKDYFVASRRARNNGGSSVEECLPIGAIQTMTALAEAHARLSLRSKVTQADAVAVIALYEQTMVAMFGPALMSPPPPLDTVKHDEPLDSQMEQYLDSCVTWLHRYIAALLGEDMTQE